MAETRSAPEGSRGAEGIDLERIDPSNSLRPAKEQQSKYQRQARWRERNPLARWAHGATASAIRRGLLERQPCEVCGDLTTDAHHEDHRDPLRVRWLCRKHHKALHRKRAAT
jgi:hypothetical protein